MAKHSRGYWLLGLQNRFTRWKWLWWCLVTAPLWLLGVIVGISEGYTQLRGLGFLPSVKWYWHWYVIFMLAYILIIVLCIVPAANRATLQRARERSDEKARRYGTKILRAAQSMPVQVVGIAADPNIVPRVETLDVHRDRDGNIIEGSGGKKSRAIVLRCKNERAIKPPRRVGDIRNVSAQISYSGYGEATTRLPTESAVWLSEEGHKVDFPVDATHRLVVTVMDRKSEDLCLTSVQRRGATLAKKVNETPLKGNLFRVRVSWYADSERDALAERDFMLDLNAFGLNEPGLIITNLWKSHEVTKFITEGYKYLRRHHEGGSVTDLDAMNEEQIDLEELVANWEYKVSKFLETHYDSQTKTRFLGQPGSLKFRPDATRDERFRAIDILTPDTFANLERQLRMLELLDE